MNNQNVLRALSVIAIALIFGVSALAYPVGELTNLGPGMLPRIMSSLLLVIGIAMLVKSRYAPPVPMEFQVKNIAVVLGSLLGFALLSAYVNMIAGIAFLVFFASLAATTYSVVRNIKIVIGLVVVALAFQKLLGLNLPLY